MSRTHKKLKMSNVEKIALKSSSFREIYPPKEKIPTIVVENFPALGKLAAMRFLEWAQNNPGGVVSLPTGKTPEHFIKWVTELLNNWDGENARKILEESGVDPAKKPDISSLHFVQIDEFYPINPWQQNSFYSYVNEFYMDDFGFDREKALLIDATKIGLKKGESLKDVWPEQTVDLSLRYRSAKTILEEKQQAMLAEVDQWCQQYEEKIRALGGIGFFLGGIGPDGHIGFNVRGSDHYSTTRLTETNYETQAAAATDLGGIEISKNRLVITIGLGTITYNPKCAAIIIAAGEAKAGIVSTAVQESPNIMYPGTALHQLKNARFYITRGATKLMEQRQLQIVDDCQEISDPMVEKVLIDLSYRQNKRLVDLDKNDVDTDPLVKNVLKKRPESLEELAKGVRDRLIERIEKGSEALSKTRFLHTEPHHDDIMLGYLPYVVRNSRDASNQHHFLCLTGGFTSVSNAFMLKQLKKLEKFIISPECRELLDEDYFEPNNKESRDRDVWKYLDGIAGKSIDTQEEGEARRLLRNLMEVYEENDLEQIKNRMKELEHYFLTEYPGKKDLSHIQALKSMCREWEAECIWGYLGWMGKNIDHLRLGFYTGDIFTEEPTIERDAMPIVRKLREIKPHVVSVAYDPEASGPDTHYKVLQSISEALKRYVKESKRKNIKVWGYRNVWYRFHPSEANIYVPVSINMFAIMQDAFVNSFISQKDASFPSYEHDGPFSELAQKIQVEQYRKLKVCLGKKWFHENPSPLIRATRGFVFLNEMSLDEFYKSSRELKQQIENR